MAANPHTAPKEWTEVALGGWVVTAVLVEINGVSIEEKWTVQRALGTSGSVTVWGGTLPNEDLVLTFEGPTPATFDAFAALWAKLAPKNGQRPPTVPIRHPAPNFVGINRVSRKKWTGPYKTPSLSWRVDVALIQYFPLIVVPAGPQQPAKLTEPSPVDEGEKVLKSLASKLQELS